VSVPEKLTMLVVGDIERAEFRASFAQVADADFAQRADIREALVYLQGHDAPAVIVLAQSRPGEFAAGEVEELRRAAPLARLWTLAGSWCEGEVRSGKPPAGAMRSYWHQWPARLSVELDRIADGLSPAWSLPVTAGEEDRVLRATGQPAERRTGLIVVRGNEREAIEALADACGARGYSTVSVHGERPQTAVSGALAILWDTFAERAADPSEVHRIRRDAGDAPLIAILGFPRVEEIQRAFAAGVHSVVSKPFRLEDLFWQLDQIATRATETPR
jgi:CheY-like chemotaxis protein